MTPLSPVQSARLYDRTANAVRAEIAITEERAQLATIALYTVSACTDDSDVNAAASLSVVVDELRRSIAVYVVGGDDPVERLDGCARRAGVGRNDLAFAAALSAAYTEAARSIAARLTEREAVLPPPATTALAA